MGSPILNWVNRQPSCVNSFGLPNSTVHVAFARPYAGSTVPSTIIRTCGAIHSTLEMMPLSVVGFFQSYSDANGWCASRGAANPSTKKPAISVRRIYASFPREEMQATCRSDRSVQRNETDEPHADQVWLMRMG